MAILPWLLAAALALLAVGHTGYGTINDIIFGFAGALAGTYAGEYVGIWLFDVLGMPCPFGGPLGSIITCFTGFVAAVALLASLRIFHASRARSSSARAE